jgi:type IV pilus assembly protein PilO
MAEGTFLSRVPLWAQILIVLVGVGVLIFLMDLLLFQETRTNAEKTEKQALQIEAENQKLEVVRVQLNEYKKAIDQMLQDLRSYRERIPEEVRISATLGDLQNQARGDLTVIREFTPSPVVSKDFYKEKSVKMKVGTTYSRLGKFFEHIAGFPRIVSISDVEIRQADKQTPNLTIEASYTLTTYYASEQDILNTSGSSSTDTGAAPKK